MRPVAPSGSRPPQRVFHPLAFGKYYLIDRIGTGGMAEVFRALPIRSHGDDPSTSDDLIVIKRILPHIAENEDFVDMFSDEANITAALRHPNVVRVFDFGQVHQDPYIAMEYVPGKDLRNVLRRLAHHERYLDLSLCAVIAHEVCRGLHYAHTLNDPAGQPYNVVHRDVSPANVLLGYDGAVKLTDFGVAKASSNVNRTKSGIFKGKFDYMSPEQAEGRDIDHRADLFSAGIVLFEMVTCRRLFKAESEIATLQKIRNAKIPSMGHYRPGVAPEIEQICLRALSRDRDDRFPTAEAMADALMEFITPGTIEEGRERLAALLDADFPDERAAEEQRLTAGLGSMPVSAPPRLDATWEGGTPSTIGDRLTSRPETLRSAMTGALVMAAFLAVIGLLGLGVAAVRPSLFAGFAFDAVGPEGLTAEPPAVTGVELVIEPAGRVEIDGELRGEGRRVVVEGLTPGDHALRVVAPGHAPHTSRIALKPGQVAPLTVELVAEAPVVVDPNAPVVRIESTPPGAEVFVDGVAVGVTPMRWAGGTVGQDYAVELQRPGSLSEARALAALEAGETTFTVELQADPMAERVLLDPQGEALEAAEARQVSSAAAAAEEAEDAETPASPPNDEAAPTEEATPAEAPTEEAPATDEAAIERVVPDLIEPFAEDAPATSRLTVSLVTVEQAVVYVDGTPLPDPAPFTNLEVPAGSHTVRVVNEKAGVDWTTTAEFDVGNTVSLRVTP